MTTTTAAALQADVTIATIRTWCRRGVIAATKQAGRWVIDPSSLARRIEIGARRMANPAHGIDEDTLRDIRRAQLGRARRTSHKPALADRYVLPSIGTISYEPQIEQGLVEALTVGGFTYYVLTEKAVAIRAQLTTHKETSPVTDLTATYTGALIPGETPRTFTTQVKERTTRDGEHLITVRGLIPHFADQLDAITDEGDRIAALNTLHGKIIVISDRADTDWDDAPEALESGRLRTTYRGGIPGITVDDVLNLAKQLRTQLAA